MNKFLMVWGIVMSLVLASCGGGASAPSTNIEVTMSDFKFQPDSFTVPAGQEITLKVTNSGGVIHSLVIMQGDKSAGTEFNEEDQPNVYWETEIPAGGSNDTSFIAPSEPGEYEIVCHIPGHVQAGMVGILNVVAGE